MTDSEKKAEALRCVVTGHICGTDTWPAGWSCSCEGCRRYMARDMIRAAHASGFREGVEAAAKVFKEFSMTPDTDGMRRTTQEEIDRTAAAFIALLKETP